MKKIYPTELINFLECRTRAYLHNRNVPSEEIISDELAALRTLGLEHEKKYLASLSEVVEIDLNAPQQEQFVQTMQAIQSGVKNIYQPFLQNGELAGYADFLHKSSKPSALGDFSYSISDTKLSTIPQVNNVVQLLHYSKIVEALQGVTPEKLNLQHGDGSQTNLQGIDYQYYYEEVLSEYKKFIANGEVPEPVPIVACKSCGYKNYCEKFWQENDHPAKINGIKLSQLEKLKENNIKSIRTLIDTPWDKDFGISEVQYKQLKLQALAQTNDKIILKATENLDNSPLFARGGLILNMFKKIAPDGKFLIYYFGIKVLNSERYEEIFIEEKADEVVGFERLIKFVHKYIERYNVFLFLWSSADIKMLHELSNKHNICHDEIDSLFLGRKIYSIQSLLSNSFYLPVVDNSLLTLCEKFLHENEEELMILKENPLLIKELCDYKNSDEFKIQLSNRGKVELKLIENLLKCLRNRAKEIVNFDI